MDIVYWGMLLGLSVIALVKQDWAEGEFEFECSSNSGLSQSHGSFKYGLNHQRCPSLR